MSAIDLEQPVFHAIEWETQPTHCFYIAYIKLPSGEIIYKPGQSKNPKARVRRFGGYLIGSRPCSCPLDKGGNGRPKCDAERSWERTFSDSRLPLNVAEDLNLPGELYEVTTHANTHVRWRFATEDAAQAIVDYIEQANQLRAG